MDLDSAERIITAIKKGKIEKSIDPRKIFVFIPQNRQFEFQTFISKYNFELTDYEYNPETEELEYLVFDPDLDRDSLLYDIVEVFGICKDGVNINIDIELENILKDRIYKAIEGSELTSNPLEIGDLSDNIYENIRQELEENNKIKR